VCEFHVGKAEEGITEERFAPGKLCQKSRGTRKEIDSKQGLHLNGAADSYCRIAIERGRDTGPEVEEHHRSV